MPKPPSGSNKKHLVYANSSANIFIEESYPGDVSFTIPIQYSIDVGDSNDAVGLNVEINAINHQDTDLTSIWGAKYYTLPERQPPDFKISSGVGAANTITVVTNEFNQEKNYDGDWYGNMTFGIKTPDGFMGSTWQPIPGTTTTITPILSFYIATGSFKANQLADYETIFTNSAVVNLEDFDNFEATVTRTETGTWTVTKGVPSSS